MTNRNTPRYTAHYPLSQLFVRFFTGFVSGSSGALVLGIIMLTTWELIGTVMSPPQEAIDGSVVVAVLNPITVILVGISIFLATMLSNIVYTILISIVDEKYEQKRVGTAYVFIGGLILAMIMIPLYIYLSVAMGVDGIGICGVLHAILFSIYTILALEIVNQDKYIIVSLLGSLMGISIFTLFSVSIFRNAGENMTVLILTLLPLLLGCMSLANTMIEGLYGWFYRTYGTDAFSQLNNDEQDNL